MKTAIKTASDRIVAIVILLTMAIVSVGCILGIVAMMEYNVYDDNGEIARDTAIDIVSEDLFDAIEKNYYNCLLKAVNANALQADENGELVLPRLENGDALLRENTRYLSESIVEKFDAEHCNVIFTIRDENGNELWYNYRAEDVAQDLEPVTDANGVVHKGMYNMIYNPVRTVGCDLPIQVQHDAQTAPTGISTVYLTVELKFYEPLHGTEWHARDSISTMMWWIDRAVELRYTAFVVAAISITLMLAVLTMLTVSAGKTDENEEIVLGFIDRLPLDLVGLCSAGVCGITAIFIRLTYIADAGMVTENIVTVIGSCAVTLSVLTFVETFSVRIKMGRPFRNTMVNRLRVSLLRKTPKRARAKLRKLSTFQKLLAVLGGIMLASSLVIAYFMYCDIVLDDLNFSYYVLVWVASRLIAIPLIIMFAMNISYVKDAGQRIAGGDLESADVSSQLSIRAIRAHGENLDHIKRDMSRAIEQEMKSERFRNELISNISHDINTPLTSIINFVDILQRKNLTEEQRREYLQILQKQTGRLRFLTRNLTDISKYTTGTVELHLEPLDLGVLTEQMVGEHFYDLQSHNLTAEFEKEDKEYVVMADGELMGRVIGNLLNNVIKYAMESTRVYVRVKEEQGKVQVMFRNVSREIPEQSAEELVERTVRGDASRHTEGSGLGLSIVKSLTELQHGTFRVEMDGDLFIAVLIFDRAQESAVSGQE